MRLVIRGSKFLYDTLFFLELVIKILGLFWYLVKPLGGGMEAGASGLHYERGRS